MKLYVDDVLNLCYYVYDCYRVKYREVHQIAHFICFQCYRERERERERERDDKMLKIWTFVILRRNDI